MERSNRGSRRRTSRIDPSRIGIDVALLTVASPLRARLRRRQSGRVRFVAWTFTARIGAGRALHRSGLLIWLLLVAWRWRRVLSRLLLLLLLLLRRRLPLVGVLLAIVRREWLTVCAVELCIGWRLLTTPDSMRRNESLRLGRDGGEDTLLREALAISASTIFGLIEARATDLQKRSQSAPGVTFSHLPSCMYAPFSFCSIDMLWRSSDEEPAATVRMPSAVAADMPERTSAAVQARHDTDPDVEVATSAWLDRVEAMPVKLVESVLSRSGQQRHSTIADRWHP